jgi:acetyl esterase/lipase
MKPSSKLFLSLPTALFVSSMINSPINLPLAAAPARENAKTEAEVEEANPPTETRRPQPTQRLVFKDTSDAAGQTVQLHLNIFNPTGHKAGDKTPVFVFFFGGGWNTGNPRLLFQHCAYFASRGIVAIAPEYRVKNRQNTTPFECVADGKSAIRYVRAHATELGIAPDKIVAAGTSAGGHVAACAAIIPGLDEKGEDTALSSVPNALVLYNPVIDTSPKGFGNARLKERWKEISPLQQVRPGLPPTIVFHGDADQTVPYANAVAFTEAMKRAGNRCELVTFPGVGHGFVPRFATPTAQSALRDTDKFLVSLGYLRGEPTL